MARTALNLPAALRRPTKRGRDGEARPERVRPGEDRRGGRGVLARARVGRKRDGEARPGPGRHVLPLPLRLLAMLVAFAFMVAFAVVLARLTLQPSPASVALTHSNLHPGSSLRAYVDHGQFRDTVKQIGGNVLLGVPFGVLVPVLAPRARGVLHVVALTALVMLMVELVQGALITGRAFDIDDVILNTTGALLGWLFLGRRLGRAVHAREPRPAD
ncbi:VanZ family protein [Streptomyces collinus]|uniref:VanZ family protein n=1 Tax=Streptomyces collinus TaxID=42684 RepID=UPI0036A7418E